MNPDLIASYLSPENDESFWFWSDDLETIQWWNGETIAFYQEAELILRELQPRGLPQFPEIILVLAACRSNWDATEGGIAILGEFLNSLKISPSVQFIVDEGADLFRGLSKVNRLFVQGGKTDLEKKIEILNLLFEDRGDHVSPQDALKLTEGDFHQVLSHSTKRVSTKKPQRTPTLLFTTVIRDLLDALPRLDGIESLEMREETGLDHLPVAPAESEEDATDADKTRSLIDDLANDTDKEFSGLGQIARDLLGVLNIPRELSEPEEMPMGGFSDIANQGTLDRLLLTELAQDDEVLAVRVALNEALYLRRESPPKNPPRHRRIFVDNGIRLWGIPRAFAHAVALALAGNAGRDSVEIVSTDTDYKVENSTIGKPVDFTTKAGLVEGLSRLSPSPEPSAQLIEFLSEFDTSDDAADQILVTHPDVLQDANYLKALQKYARELPFYIATVDTTGELRMLLKTGNGDRQIQKLHLDIDKLFGEEEVIPLRSTKEMDPALPKILGFEPFPLLFSQPIKETHCWASANGEVVTLTRRGLFLYREQNRGAVLLSDENFGKGHCFFGEFGPGDRFIVAMGQMDNPKVIIADLNTGQVIQHRCQLGSKVLHGHYINGRIVFITANHAIAIDPETAEETHRVAIRGRPHRSHGRFLLLENSWVSVAVNSTIELTPIEYRQGYIELVFDCPFYSVPLALTNQGEVLQFDGDENPVVPFTKSDQIQVKKVLGVFNNGAELVYKSFDTEQCPIVSLDFENKQRRTSRCQNTTVDSAVFALRSHQPSLRKNFHGVHISFGGLALIPYPRLPSIPIFQKADSIVFEGPGSSTHDIDIYQFERIESPASGYDLQKATFPDGSMVYLDSRGMIHLKSADPKIPEITMILEDRGTISGWISSGEYFGRDYFIGSHQKTSASTVAELLVRFTNQIIR